MRRLEGLNVLVVGDRNRFAESITSALLSDGHAVGDVPDGTLALAAAGKALPDVVVMDADGVGLDAPAIAESMGGLSVARRPLFIALTEWPSRECPPPAAGSGIDLYLGKPADTAGLRHLLRRFQTVVKDFESFDPMI